MKLLRSLAALLCLMPAVALAESGAKPPPGLPYSGGTLTGPLLSPKGGAYPGYFWAKGYGSCSWTLAGDVGPCVNAAIAAAAAAGGGKVVLDGGAYGQATPIVNTTTGVQLVGAGVGDPRGIVAPGSFQAATRLVWNGAGGATMFSVGPAAGATKSLHAAGVDGVVFDCSNIAAVCAKITQVSHSTFNLGAAEPTSVGIWTTTALISDSPGVQDNDFWLQSRSTSSSNSPTGIFLDGNTSTCTPGTNCWNTSYNRFHKLYAWTAKGDGIVFGDSDNNLIFDINGYRQPGSGSGTPVVFASVGYVMPNGITVGGPAYTNRVLHTAFPARLAGYTTGATFVAGTNAGTAAPTTVTLPTTAATTYPNSTLTFASTSTIAQNMRVNCGGTDSGVLTGNSIYSLTGTAVTLSGSTVGNVASGTSCAFTYSFTPYAVSGAYTLTATSPTSFNLTAPSGGHSQSGIALSGGVLSFTDLVIPMSGTAVAGDTWTIKASVPSTQNVLEYVDKANAIPNPMFEAGATGYRSTSANPIPSGAGTAGLYLGVGIATGSANGRRAISMGETTSAGGDDSVAMANCNTSQGFGICAGPGTSSGGFGAIAFGHNVNGNGSFSFAAGESVSTGGSYSVSLGAYATDRSDQALAFTTSRFSTTGDAQQRQSILRASLSSTSATRLTTDGNAAGAGNGLRIPTNAIFGVVADQVVCFEAATQTSFAKWKRKDGVLNRASGSASYAGDASAATAPDQSGGAASSATLTLGADTTNNVLAMSIIWPNANAVRCVASARTLELQ